MALADSVKPDKFVLDVRSNGGGNNRLSTPIVHAIIKREGTIGRPGHFFVIVGRSTFSAAQNFTTQLSENTNAVFVGEPTGGSPNQYGDAARLTLPNSRLNIQLATVWWQDADPRDERVWIPPDVAAELSVSDERAGRDPALDAILHYSPLPFPTDALRAAIDAAGESAGLAVVRKWTAEPRNKFRTAGDEIAQLGVDYFGRNDIPHAVAAFEVNAAIYPDSWRAQEGLARAYVAAARNEDALLAARRALARNPKAAISRGLVETLAPKS